MSPLPWLQRKSFVCWTVRIVFLILHGNICCGYSLEAPCRGASNEYPQHMFSWRNIKNVMGHLILKHDSRDMVSEFFVC